MGNAGMDEGCPEHGSAQGAAAHPANVERSVRGGRHRPLLAVRRHADLEAAVLRLRLRAAAADGFVRAQFQTWEHGEYATPEARGALVVIDFAPPWFLALDASVATLALAGSWLSMYVCAMGHRYRVAGRLLEANGGGVDQWLVAGRNLFIAGVCVAAIAILVLLGLLLRGGHTEHLVEHALHALVACLAAACAGCFPRRLVEGMLCHATVKGALLLTGVTDEAMIHCVEQGFPLLVGVLGTAALLVQHARFKRISQLKVMEDCAQYEAAWEAVLRDEDEALGVQILAQIEASIIDSFPMHPALQVQRYRPLGGRRASKQARHTKTSKAQQQQQQQQARGRRASGPASTLFSSRHPSTPQTPTGSRSATGILARFRTRSDESRSRSASGGAESPASPVLELNALQRPESSEAWGPEPTAAKVFSCSPGPSPSPPARSVMVRVSSAGDGAGIECRPLTPQMLRSSPRRSSATLQLDLEVDVTRGSQGSGGAEEPARSGSSSGSLPSAPASGVRGSGGSLSHDGPGKLQPRVRLSGGATGKMAHLGVLKSRSGIHKQFSKMAQRADSSPALNDAWSLNRGFSISDSDVALKRSSFPGQRSATSERQPGFGVSMQSMSTLDPRRRTFPSQTERMISGMSAVEEDSMSRTIMQRLSLAGSNTTVNSGLSSAGASRRKFSILGGGGSPNPRHPSSAGAGAATRRQSSAMSLFNLVAVSISNRLASASSQIRRANGTFSRLEGELVDSLDQLYLQAELLHPVLKKKVQGWAALSEGCFPLCRDSSKVAEWQYLVDRYDSADTAETHVKWATIKNVRRAKEKLVRSYEGRPSRLLDVCRQSIVFKTTGALAECLKTIADDPDVVFVGIKNRMHEDYAAQTRALGYRDVNLSIRFDSAKTRQMGVDLHICEVQLLLHPFAQLKSADGHKRYIAWRNCQAR